MHRTKQETTNNGQAAADVKALAELRTQAHLEVTLPYSNQYESLVETLYEAISGLFPGERPTIVVDKKHNKALIAVPELQIERLQYKSFIIHKPTSRRYPCRFCEGTNSGVSQRRVTVTMPGAKFAFLKSQQHVRDRLKRAEPLIRASWQPCTGAQMCYVRLHYSSDEPELLEAVEEMRLFLEAEAAKILLACIPLNVPPCERFDLSNDPEFRKVSYDHNVSLWTRTQRDSPLGPDWCTFATDDPDKMNATIQAYIDFAARSSTRFDIKVLKAYQNAPAHIANGTQATHTSNHKFVTPAGSLHASPAASDAHAIAQNAHQNNQHNANARNQRKNRTNTNARAAYTGANSTMTNNTKTESAASAYAYLPTYDYVPSYSDNATATSVAGFGPRGAGKNAPARSIATEDEFAPSAFSSPSSSPSNLPSDLPPGLNIADLHISAPKHIAQPLHQLLGDSTDSMMLPLPPMTLSGAPATTMSPFAPMLTGLEPLKFPSNDFYSPYKLDSFMTPSVTAPLAMNIATNASSAHFMPTPTADNVWDKYSPPTESFVPSAALDSSSSDAYSYSDYFASEAPRIFALTESSGRIG